MTPSHDTARPRVIEEDAPVAERPFRSGPAVFATEATDPARYLVTFLPGAPAQDKVDALPRADSGDYLVRGRELYLWLPDGISNTPLAAWKWDTLLGVAGTARNWNTVTKLAELAG